MLFSRSFLLAAIAAPLFAFAQQSGSTANPFTLTNTFSPRAGQDVKITWTPTTSGTVTLVLRQGSSNDLDTVQTIAPSVPNSGSYTWSVPNSAVRGSDYSLEIVSDSNPTDTNYSAYFVLESQNTVASSSSSSASSSASSTGASSTSASTSGSTTTRASSTDSTKATTSATSSTNTRSSSTTGAPQSTTSESDLQQSVTTTNTGAAPRATAMVGMLGAVALGALAL